MGELSTSNPTPSACRLTPNMPGVSLAGMLPEVWIVFGRMNFRDQSSKVALAFETFIDGSLKSWPLQLQSKFDVHTFPICSRYPKPLLCVQFDPLQSYS